MRHSLSSVTVALLAASSLATQAHADLRTHSASQAVNEGSKSRADSHNEDSSKNSAKPSDKRRSIYEESIGNGGKFTFDIVGIEPGARINDRFTFCRPDTSGGTKPSENISPAISWANPPAGTKSLALIVVDTDVPASFDKANRPGEYIEPAAPRQNFYHWVLVNIPATVSGILEGKDSSGITEGGKPYGLREYGMNGQNDYIKVFPGGQYGGYDGPCPPWNDQRIHNYHFRIYALDIPSIQLPQPFNGTQVEILLKSHILEMKEEIGTYTNYQPLIKKDKKAARKK